MAGVPVIAFSEEAPKVTNSPFTARGILNSLFTVAIIKSNAFH